MIKAVIFDFGGVVFKNSMKYVYKKTSEKFKIDIETVKRRASPLIHKWDKNRISSNEFWKQFALKLKADPEEVKNVWDKTFAKYSVPNKKVIEIVKQLKRSGHRVALLSNTVKPHADYHKNRGDFILFSPIFLSHEMGMSKPSQNVYKYVLKKMELKPKDCLFIDNKMENVEGAKKVGMKTIFFKNATQLRKELKKVLQSEKVL